MAQSTSALAPVKESQPILPPPPQIGPLEGGRGREVQRYTEEGGGTQLQEKISKKVAEAKSQAMGEEGEVTQVEQLVLEREGASFTSTVFNFINSIVGSGLIGIPFAFKEAGFGMGFLLLVMVCGMMDYSLRLVVRAGTLSGTDSYQGIMEAAFGRPGFYLLSIEQFIFPFIAMVSYNIIAGDTLTKLMEAVSGSGPEGDSEHLTNSVLTSRTLVILVVTCLITLPLSLYRNINQLAKASLLSILFVVFIILTVCIRLPTLGSHVPFSADAWSFAHVGLPKAVAIMAFAFVCHHNTFLLYSAMRERTESAWSRVTHISCLASFLAMSVMGVVGYLTFTGATQGDLLENYCHDDTLMNISRLFFSFTVLLTFPIECFVCREVLLTLFWRDSKDQGWKRHVLITMGLVTAATVTSMATDCLGVVLELNGIIAAVPLAFVFPPLCYLKLRSGPVLTKSSVPAIFMVVFGVVVALTGGVLLISQGLPGCSHGSNPCTYTANSSLIYDSSVLY